MLHPPPSLATLPQPPSHYQTRNWARRLTEPIWLTEKEQKDQLMSVTRLNEKGEDYAQTCVVDRVMNSERPFLFERTHPAQRSQGNPLSLVLRHSCTAEHRALEEMIGFKNTSAPPGAYVSLLLMFRALHCGSLSWRETFAYECRYYEVPRELLGLVSLINRDLETLRISVLPQKKLPIVIDRESGFPMALGSLYVVAGSMLGNAIILRHVRSISDPVFTGATQFLSASASEAGPTFQTFRLFLDDFGTRMPDTYDAVIEGAQQTFRACARLLESLRA
jgi:heme oxygenase